MRVALRAQAWATGATPQQRSVPRRPSGVVHSIRAEHDLHVLSLPDLTDQAVQLSPLVERGPVRDPPDRMRQPLGVNCGFESPNGLTTKNNSINPR